MTWILTRNTSRRNSKHCVIQRYPIRSCHPRWISQKEVLAVSKYFQHQTSLLESSAIPQVLHLQTELGSKAQTKLEMMLDEMEPMKFHEIKHFENLLMLYDHLEFQYDISQEMDKLQKKVSLLQKLFEILHSIFDSKTQKPKLRRCQ